MVVNCESISVSRIDCLSGIRLVQLGDFPGSAKSSYARFILTSPETEAEYPGSPAQISIGTMNGTASTRSLIRLVHSDGSITISSGSSITFNQRGSEINLPNKAGTIALTTDIKQLYMLTLYWDSKKPQTIPDITANMYVSHLTSRIQLGLNTFDSTELSQVINILSAAYFSEENPNLKIVTNGYSIYNNNINICRYIYYNTSRNTLVANLAQGLSNTTIGLGDITSFSTLSIYVTQLG